MMSAGGAAGRIAGLVERVLAQPSPLAIRAWDGSRAGPADGPVIVVTSRRALRRVLWQPDELGLARAWVAGELDVEGDLEEALAELETVLDRVDSRPKLSASDRAEALRSAVLLGALGPQPKPPVIEAELAGERHSKKRDRAAISHHYDVGNDFYELVLGSSMVYSCAYWTKPDDPAYTLEDAQRDKHDLVCRKLGLEPGMRLLDVGCGWGSLVLHAAREYGVRAVGVTLSEAQGEFAQRRIDDAGIGDLAEVRVQDWRDIDDGPYDAIASVGMAEHLGARNWPSYTARLYELLSPGGRLLNQQIVRAAQRHATHRSGRRRTFIDAYVFPDGELMPIGDIVSELEGAGFEVRDVHNLREHYARTLRAWVDNVETAWMRAVRLAGTARARVWRLYMTGSALSFDAGRIAIHQVLAVRRDDEGRSHVPMVRTV
ncbi:class I SAM-dependent methyltransferase [Actinobacteria bacterium YIM 96077]|uniref:SAM-dependent methyltransferase n=1 Tax=Phytoactinopolyspora halophila TaxID=1981511 RepID=A0A329QJL3_9ACTN|nr:cyclopropane-fatty-acyl-phospholipid synthase family protein [Phytoactinopolyspora halophila]AYY14389.1 class I SAM-dependent methyltransferase [Actinobacteria bacterium YIM 96077]RAW11889.1 SAM-dependent methyltransferase [Phytoactinopolyspora halophila]